MPVLLLDTYSLLYRAFHALPPMSTAGGAPTSALYGLSVLLCKLLREQRPAGMAFALDAGPSFRRDLLPGYKASRERAPSALRDQVARVPELVAALGVPAHAARGYEADDVLATLARELDGDALVVSGDRDLLQCTRFGAEVLFVGRRGRDHVRYDAAAVQRRFGVPPARLPSYVALVGDPSDDLPGIPGVGPKTAARWIMDAGDIDGVLSRVDALEPARLRQTVRERAETLRLCERLARLDDRVPLGEGAARTGAIDAEAIARLRAWFEQLEFRSLLARADELAR